MFEVNLNHFLFLGFESLNWSKGIHLNRVKAEWRDILRVFQRYITCEGHFSTIFRYHLRFMLHINRESKLNLPYYMLKSVEKMIVRVRNHPKNSIHSVFHQGLIKILINFELGKTGISWQHFILWFGFEFEAQYHDDEEVRR